MIADPSTINTPMIKVHKAQTYDTDPKNNIMDADAIQFAPMHTNSSKLSPKHTATTKITKINIIDQKTICRYKQNPLRKIHVNRLVIYVIRTYTRNRIFILCVR